MFAYARPRVTDLHVTHSQSFSALILIAHISIHCLRYPTFVTRFLLSRCSASSGVQTRSFPPICLAKPSPSSSSAPPLVASSSLSSSCAQLGHADHEEMLPLCHPSSPLRISAKTSGRSLKPLSSLAPTTPAFLLLVHLTHRLPVEVKLPCLGVILVPTLVLLHRAMNPKNSKISLPSIPSFRLPPHAPP
jgi:hypothetical protein